MERNDRNRYDHGGYRNESRYDRDYDNRYYERDLNDQFERDYQRSQSQEGNFYRDAAYERNQNYNRSNNYRQRDADLERRYYDNTRGDRGTLGDIRQGYGISGFGGTSDRYNTAGDMQRERDAQYEQGYGSGRMGGYSGSRFGGSNYSAHGDFGGSPEYGSMSGGGGNSEEYVSRSGYGGGYGDSAIHSDRGVPNYSSRSFADNAGRARRRDYPNADEHQDFDRDYAANADRGGYTNRRTDR